MKKTLVAVAALVATGAFAQVTIYGNLDQTVYNNAGSAGTTDAQAGWISNGNSSSFWAIKGTDDLGGGLTASFAGISEITLASGAAGSTTTGANGAVASKPDFFNRGMFVSLASSSVGSLTVGRQPELWFATSGGFNTSGSNSLGSGNMLAGLNNAGNTGAGSGFRNIQGGVPAGVTNAAASGTTGTANSGDTGPSTAFGNAVTYATPVISGFQGSVQINGGDKYSNGGSGNGLSLSGTYTNGPLKLAAAQGARNDGAGNSNSWVNTFYGASYNYGAYTFIGIVNKTAFSNGMAANDNLSVWSLGLNYAVSSKIDFNVAYGVISDDVVTDNKATQLGFIGRYKFTPRTQMYAGVGSVKNEGAANLGAIYGASAANPTNASTNAYMMGIKHTF